MAKIDVYNQLSRGVSSISRGGRGPNACVLASGISNSHVIIVLPEGGDNLKKLSDASRNHTLFIKASTAQLL